ncbi:MAG: T9SS type A sorting domain-containing protein, partial [Ichthyobacteriaceae bacterium]|nr:T9SS type A sorting domain-containing protein [Ichthyobacteriaceae bacterium]
SNNKTETLNIFPNPTVSGNFSISTEGLSNNSVIEVYNVTGQQVASEVIDASASVYNVELGLVKGLYIVKVIDGANVSTQKLIVE